jgi:hypothetical protein
LNSDTEESVFSSSASFSINPQINGAGLYEIVADPRNMFTPQNYDVEYINGYLYVNPEEKNSKSIKVFCDCVEEVSGDPQGLNYIARFYYENANDETIYILAGADNYIIGDGIYEGALPEAFLPGVGQFQLRFDGNLIKWNLESYDSKRKTSSTSEASSNSKKCNLNSGARLSGTTINTESLEGQLSIKSYPNPVISNLYVEADFSESKLSELYLVDVNGRLIHPDYTIHNNSRLEVDMSQFSKGLYIMKLDFGIKQKMLKVIKQ